MDCIQYLFKLLANFVYLQYKFHTIHTDMKGALFLPVHSLMDEIYQFFGDDNIDRIKERARIIGGQTPTSIFELSQLTDIQELSAIPGLSESMTLIVKDLRFMEAFIEKGIEITGETCKDLVTQNTLIDYADAIGKFRWKLESTLARETVLPAKGEK